MRSILLFSVYFKKLNERENIFELLFLFLAQFNSHRIITPSAVNFDNSIFMSARKDADVIANVKGCTILGAARFVEWFNERPQNTNEKTYCNECGEKT